MQTLKPLQRYILTFLTSTTLLACSLENNSFRMVTENENKNCVRYGDKPLKVFSDGNMEREKVGFIFHKKEAADNNIVGLINADIECIIKHREVLRELSIKKIWEKYPAYIKSCERELTEIAKQIESDKEEIEQYHEKIKQLQKEFEQEKNLKNLNKLAEELEKLKTEQNETLEYLESHENQKLQAEQTCSKVKKEKPNLIEDVEQEYDSHYNKPNVGAVFGISICSKNITKIPQLPYTTALLELEYLDLEECMVVRITNIEPFKSIKRLNLKKNEIKIIENLGPLVNLEKLYLDYNQIEKIEGLGNLKSLTNLSLDHNQIEEVGELSELGSLTDLSISCNKLQKIKPLNKLEFLTTLNFSDNPLALEEFDCEVCPKNVKFLNLRDTKILKVLNISSLASNHHLTLYAPTSNFFSAESLNNMNSSKMNLRLYFKGAEDLPGGKKGISENFSFIDIPFEVAKIEKEKQV